VESHGATAELDAAREIQQRLVPKSIPAFTGCHIEAAYLPVHEVGGDFCQILPRPDGSVVIAVGDVSGKGLKAAMIGVLAIGALRTLAFEGLDPAAILMRLNAELVRASNGGFVTCFFAEYSTPPAPCALPMPGTSPLSVTVVRSR
jgi:serine phosphatase RsbU (regulator of sigma subunit)